MKLYTEEQVRHLADCIHGADTEKILASLTPIELPSDEEIHKLSPHQIMNSNNSYDIGFHNGWKQGAKMVINKIQGGKK